MPEEQPVDPSLLEPWTFQPNADDLPFDFSEHDGKSLYDMNVLIGDISRKWGELGVEPRTTNTVDMFQERARITALIQYLAYIGLIDIKDFAAFHSRVMYQNLVDEYERVKIPVQNAKAQALMEGKLRGPNGRP